MKFGKEMGKSQEIEGDADMSPVNLEDYTTEEINEGAAEAQRELDEDDRKQEIKDKLDETEYTPENVL